MDGPEALARRETAEPPGADAVSDAPGLLERQEAHEPAAGGPDLEEEPAVLADAHAPAVVVTTLEQPAVAAYLHASATTKITSSVRGS